MNRRSILQGLHEFHGEPRSDVGPVAQYLADVYELRPEVVRIEQLEFVITFTNGVETARTVSQRVDPEFMFALRRIKGWASAPDDTSQFVDMVTFNVDDQGRARGGIFRNPIRMSTLCDINGSPAHDMVWDAFYGFVAGADVDVTWNVDTTDFPEQGVVRFGVSLTGDLLRTRRLPGGAMVV
ncbi:MAG TPA: hypothetical protein PKD27_02435, partial [Tepidiformaceae bacterium]|nr:hypothetical protein [Tepidiformaceae bacterium]